MSSDLLAQGHGGPFRVAPHDRAQRAQAGWLAVRQLLDQVPVDVSVRRNFEVLASFIDAASESAVHALWRDPDSYYRTRLTMDLFRAARLGVDMPPLAAAYARSHGADALAAFEAALASWALTAIAVAVHERRDLSLPSPYVAQRPLGLPGLALVLGESSCVAGVRGGVPVSTEGAEIPLLACPTIEVGAVRVRMQPYVFMVPGLVQGLPDVAYQRSQQDLLRSVYELIADVVPATLRDLGATSQVTILKPYDASDFVNQTHSHLPGGAMLSAVPQVHELADKLIHEWAHDRLFALEEDGPFLADPEQVVDESIYSPWRDDLRAVQGILHAVFVHLHVWPFWRALHARDLPSDVRALTTDRLMRYVLQLRLGLHQVRLHGTLTDRGEALVQWMGERTAELDRVRVELGLGGSEPAVRVTVEGEIVPEVGTDQAPLTILAAVHRHAQRCGGADTLAALASSVA